MWLLHTHLHPFDRDIPGVTRQKRHNGKRRKIIYCLSFPYYDFTASGYTGLIQQILIGCCLKKKISLGRSNTNKSESHLMSATHDISPFNVNENQEPKAHMCKCSPFISHLSETCSTRLNSFLLELRGSVHCRVWIQQEVFLCDTSCPGVNTDDWVAHLESPAVHDIFHRVWNMYSW